MKLHLILSFIAISCLTSINAFGAAPTTQARNIVISNKTATSATISWTNGNGAKRVVFVENPSGTARAPYDNTTYTASADWNIKGTQLPDSYYYCVYNGAGNTVTITNLTPNQTYAVRISEYNGDAGTEQYLTDISSVTGNPITFTTPEMPVAPTTQASNIVISNKTATSATISWTNGNGAKRVVFVENPSATAAAPYNNNTYTASADWSVKGTRIGTSNYYCVYNGDGNTVTVTNLAPNQTFAVRISEYNGDAGTEQYLTDISSVNGNPITFTTPVMPVAPTTQASNIVISNKTATSATISWTNGNGAKRVVFVENPSGTARAPYNNTTYSASADWNTKGTQLPNSNYYCVYNGEGNMVTITNLAPNATYAVRISEYNGDAGTEQYLTDISSVNDNPITFTTLTATNIENTEGSSTTVSVSPNPTTGRIMVTAAKLSGERMSITVRDLQGNAVHQSMTQNTSKEIDLTSMPSGIYIVLIEIGGETTTHKVIKN